MEGESIGLLVGADRDKAIHSYLSEHLRVHGWRNHAYVSNDPRMLAALKLLGYETIARVKVQGIERFCNL